ncbi:hypothetical protein BA190_27530 [Labrys sp. WJW]|uniref:DUF1833 family protein n=1 Tax=Labrys sp. WJW TaxID=1737983 RepID=UPI00083653A7|nr:DUF1833 family protein [Labrys sp. WJW]OCC01716.1 hypothetical protein BA190_27530 [Labrys sp. WJW]
MRTLSARFRAALYRENMEEVPAMLITITHPDLTTPLHFSSDPTERISTEPLLYGTVSRGTQYNFVPFQVTLPADQDDAPPTIDITLSVVGREAVPLLRSAIEPPSVTLEIILAQYPDDVEAVFPDFDLVSASYGGDSATISLAIDSMASEPFPAGSFTPSYFPGMF